MPTLPPEVEAFEARNMELNAATEGAGGSDPIAARKASSIVGDQMAREFAQPADPTVVIDRLHVPNGPELIRFTPPDIARPAPAVLEFHGGSFVLGAADDEWGIRNLSHNAADAGVVVFAVDYALAPEHPFPGSLLSAYAALTWVAENAAELGIDPARIGVMGGSSGGNLAAALCLWARDHGGPPIALQILQVPATTLNMAWATGFGVDPDADTGDEFGVSDIRTIARAYLGGVDLDGVDPDMQRYASPLEAPDLAGLPRALILTAENDILQPAGQLYAVRLQEAGVDVDFEMMPGHTHGSSGITATWQGARDWQARITKAMQSL